MNIVNRPAAALAFALALGSAAVTSAANAAEGFELINTHDTARIVSVWFARANTNEAWTAANLTTGVGPKSYSRFTFEGAKTCFYDVKVRFDDTYEQTFVNVDVCRFRKLIAS